LTNDWLELTIINNVGGDIEMSDNVKGNRIGSIRKNITRFYKDVKSELKKVIWPNRQQLVNKTMTVLLACLIAGIFIWAADLLFGKISSIVFTR